MAALEAAGRLKRPRHLICGDTFVTTVGAGANGLRTVLPTQGPSGTLSALTCAGSAKPYALQTIKGIQYAAFDAASGTYQATYS